MDNGKRDYQLYELEDFICDDSFINYVSGKNDHDKQKWQKWLSNNPDKQDVALEAKMLVKELRFKKQELSSELIKKEWLRLRNTLNLNSDSKKEKRSLYISRSTWRYAAVASILLFFFSTIYFLSLLPDKEKQFVYNDILVPKGEISKVILPDGTLVFINSDSKLSYQDDYGVVTRDIYLEGEAYFDVLHNPELPFNVHTENNTITVLGTAFNVYAYPDEDLFRTTLERGKVRVSHDCLEPQELSVNETYQLHKKTNKVEVHETVDIQSYSSWRDGSVVFRNELFTDLLRKLERSHNVTFNIQNHAFDNYRYTGTFVKEDNITTILNVVHLTTPFEFEIDNDTIFIR